MTAAIHQLKIERSIDHLECPKCHATTELKCSCGVEYVYVSAGKRAEDAVAANPEKSNRAIAKEIGGNHTTVGRARKKLGGTNVPPEKRTGGNGKKYEVGEMTIRHRVIEAIRLAEDGLTRRQTLNAVGSRSIGRIHQVMADLEASGELVVTNIGIRPAIYKIGNGQRVPRTNNSGVRIMLPNGFASFGEVIRACIEIEASGDFRGAIKKSGLSHGSYNPIRDIVVLAARDDLSAADSAIATQALRDLEQSRQLKRPYSMIRPIAEKIWGRKGHRQKSEKKRLDAFLSSISVIVTACTSAADIPIAFINQEQRSMTLADLNEAMAALTQLSTRIKNGG
jgi:hypothetical protein